MPLLKLSDTTTFYRLTGPDGRWGPAARQSLAGDSLEPLISKGFFPQVQKAVALRRQKSGF